MVSGKSTNIVYFEICKHRICFNCSFKYYNKIIKSDKPEKLAIMNGLACILCQISIFTNQKQENDRCGFFTTVQIKDILLNYYDKYRQLFNDEKWTDISLIIADKNTYKNKFMDQALKICHNQNQQARKLLDTLQYEEFAQFEYLNQIQKNAIFHIAQKSYEAHNRSQKIVLNRLQKLGYNKNHYDKFQVYIRDEAPIIIHVQISKLQYFIGENTFYRNMFETGTSNGNNSKEQRIKWENNIFNNIYKDAIPKDRVKYGVLNFLSNKQGHDKCYFYGKSFFVMKEVRLRSTFSDKDSANKNTILCTPQFFSHILEKLSDENIRQIFDLIILKKKGVSSSYQKFANYQEVQFHGLIDISKNVQSLNVCKQEMVKDPNGNKNIKIFKEKYPHIEVNYF